jgi:ubiquinone/menaquinone biosynthesis C-methylase UbiE
MEAPPFLEMLKCPLSDESVRKQEDYLVSERTHRRFRVSASGIPMFAEEQCSAEGRRQQEHYERIADRYLENLGYPHTQEYMAYLDRVFLAEVGEEKLGDCAEVCCGAGEAFQLLGSRVGRGMGIDISLSMLEAARSNLPSPNYFFVQGDATMLPIRDAMFDSVFVFGGIHHVNDRVGLFREIFRILKPGGRFYFREPVSDFFLWRWLRAVIYRMSPTLDSKTERPLLFDETEPPLQHVGFRLRSWKTFGFLGYCLLMNSDVLVFNRGLRLMPGIRAMTRLAARLDDWTTRLPGMARNGLIAVGVGEKPANGMAQ